VDTLIQQNMTERNLLTPIRTKNNIHDALRLISSPCIQFGPPLEIEDHPLFLTLFPFANIPYLVRFAVKLSSKLNYGVCITRKVQFIQLLPLLGETKKTDSPSESIISQLG
jgi:hypothetical protein